MFSWNVIRLSNQLHQQKVATLRKGIFRTAAAAAAADDDDDDDDLKGNLVSELINLVLKEIPFTLS